MKLDLGPFSCLLGAQVTCKLNPVVGVLLIVLIKIHAGFSFISAGMSWKPSGVFPTSSRRLLNSTAMYTWVRVWKSWALFERSWKNSLRLELKTKKCLSSLNQKPLDLERINLDFLYFCGIEDGTEGLA